VCRMILYNAKKKKNRFRAAAPSCLVSPQIIVASHSTSMGPASSVLPLACSSSPAGPQLSCMRSTGHLATLDALFSAEIFLIFGTVALLFLFDKHYPIIE